MNKPLTINEFPAAFDKINSRKELYALVEKIRKENTINDMYMITLLDDLVGEVRLRIDKASTAGRIKKRY